MYRQATEALTKQRLSIVSHAAKEASALSSAEQKEELYEKTEAQLDAGQLEQVLEQAVAEYSLAAKMVDWKA